ncbi:MAG: hypothetical protein Q8941_15970 [Bacteroidota bacterium]|nr:hypothetical protein [Bacteroidota bacterium]
MAIQKLEYIHHNPLAERWQLVKDPCDYKYSPARYYELNEKNFLFLKDLKREFYNNWFVDTKAQDIPMIINHLFVDNQNNKMQLPTAGVIKTSD